MRKQLRRRSRTANGTRFHLLVGKRADDVTVRLDAKGYLVFKSGFYRDVRVHRAVASAMLDRDLRRDEDVHHRDGEKLNNEPANLKVTGHSEHGWVSAIQHWYVEHVIEERESEQWEGYFGEGKSA